MTKRNGGDKVAAKLEKVLIVVICLDIILLISIPFISRGLYNANYEKYTQAVEDQTKSCQRLYEENSGDFKAVAEYFAVHPGKINATAGDEKLYDDIDRETDGACSKLMRKGVSGIKGGTKNGGYDVVFSYNTVSFNWRGSEATSMLGIVYSSQGDIGAVSDNAISSGAENKELGDGFFLFEISYT